MIILGDTVFGLPWETTFIMGGAALFWVIATLVFYAKTRSWNIEDPDYDPLLTDDDGTPNTATSTTTERGEGSR